MNGRDDILSVLEEFFGGLQKIAKCFWLKREPSGLHLS